MIYLAIAFAIAAILTIVSEGAHYAFRWYEVSNRNYDKDQTWFSAMWADNASPVRSFFMECFYSWLYTATVIAHAIFIKPLRWLRNDPPAPLNKDKPLVVLIHGYMASEDHFWLMKKRFYDNDIENVVTFGYNRKKLNVESAAEKLRDMILRIKSETGVKETVLIGHSAGGLIAYKYAMEYGEDEIRAVVALAAPFRGSRLTVLSLTPFARNLHPSNPMFAEMISTKINAPLLSVFSKYDQLVLPYTNCEHSFADENAEIAGTGHSGFYFSRNAFNIMVKWLKQRVT